MNSESSEKSGEFDFIEGLTTELSAGELIFPTSLNATMKIRRALSHPDISSDTVARVIGAEPVLSAQILRLSNTAAFNPHGRKILDLRTATLSLGFSAVRNIAISVGMRQLAGHHYSGVLFDHTDGLWSRSLRVAALSMVLAKALTKINPDKAMLTGLLHNVGKFYILNRAHHYQNLFFSEQALWDLIDQWHASIGGLILENWEIPEVICEAVMQYRDRELPLNSHPSLTDLLVAADFLDAHVVDESLYDMSWESIPNGVRNLRLDKQQCIQLLQETRAELSQVLKAIG
ncbi:MAG: HDOD domain-containing protein [Burkholderiales bacterium]|nr:HDOD domain-containing protein [Burkholderiales bacterium]